MTKTLCPSGCTARAMKRKARCDGKVRSGKCRMEWTCRECGAAFVSPWKATAIGAIEAGVEPAEVKAA